MRLSSWRPYQVTHSERHPVVQAKHTLFNLAPCNRELEVAVANFIDHATDVDAFAKNAGPQSLRIDYLAAGSRLAFYTPDFFVRTKDGHCLVVETKGREDKDVPRKARAAIAWCEAASSEKVRWEYVYVPQGVFERLTGDTVASLARTCAPALATLLQQDEPEVALPLFAAADQAASDAQEMPLGLLRNCLDFALNDNAKIEGVFAAVREKFKRSGGRKLLETVIAIYDFRNTRIAHQEKEITDPKEARRHLIAWIEGLKAISEEVA